MPLQQLGFSTSPFTGTQQRESTGEGLARLITTGMQAYEKKQDIDRVYDAGQEAELAKHEKMALNSEMLRQSDERKTFMSNAPSHEESEQFETQLKGRTSDMFSQFSSDWSKMNSSGYVASYDAKIYSHFAGDLKDKTKLMYNEIKASSAANPNITLSELNESISYLNESSGITGDTYSVAGALTSYTKSAIDSAKEINPLEFNEEQWRKDNPLLSEIEDPILRSSVNAVAAKMAAAKDGIITDINQSYTDRRLGQIFNATTNELSILNKEILSDSVDNPYITNRTRKPLLNYINTLLSRDGKGSKHEKTELNSLIKLFENSMKISSSKTYAQNKINLEKQKNNSFNVLNSIIDSIHQTLKEDEPMTAELKITELVDNYVKQIDTGRQIDSHKAGQPISSMLNSDASKFLNQKYSDMFASNLSKNSSKSTEALLSLGKVPDDYTKSVDTAIVNGDINLVGSHIVAISNLYKDKNAAAIIHRNPKLSALVSANNSLGSLEKIVPLLQEIESDPDKKSSFENTVTTYKYKLSKDSTYDNMSNATRNALARKLTYENYFSLRTETDTIEDSEDLLESTRYEEADANIFDIENKYSPKDLSTIAMEFNKRVLPSLTSPTNDTAERKLNMVVGDNGSLSISYGSIVFYNGASQSDVKEMIESFARLNKAENPPNKYLQNTLSKISKISNTVSEKLKPIVNDVITEGFLSVPIWAKEEYDRINKEAADRRSGARYKKESE